MTTIQGPWVLDDPDGTSPDPVAAVMDLAHATVADAQAEQNATLARQTSAALDEAVTLVARILEDARFDTTDDTIRTTISGLDPNHGLVTTRHGLNFEIRRATGNVVHRPTLAGTHDIWLRHPETGSPIGRIGTQTTWAHVADMIVSYDADQNEPFAPSPVEIATPAEQMATAFAEFVHSITTQPEQGGF